ncbi:hypothetical protein DFH09DRAFT_1102542 [Mycena vulgaris]|nr:hypothetical protein DFH09DRAFT_1102542 [Mycena vulgaris]
MKMQFTGLVTIVTLTMAVSACPVVVNLSNAELGHPTSASYPRVYAGRSVRKTRGYAYPRIRVPIPTGIPRIRVLTRGCEYPWSRIRITRGCTRGMPYAELVRSDDPGHPGTCEDIELCLPGRDNGVVELYQSTLMVDPSNVAISNLISAET